MFGVVFLGFYQNTKEWKIREVPKSTQKALRGALSGPGPKSTPVNGGRDRNSSRQTHNITQVIVRYQHAPRHLEFSARLTLLRARQRSGEGVARRNGCPKGCFWRVRFFSAPLRFSGPFRCSKSLSGPLNRLNAILSLLHPLDRYRTPSAIGSAIGRPLSRPISHPNTGRSPQPPRSKPLGGLNRAIVALL